MKPIGSFREGVDLAKKILASGLNSDPFSPKPISQANAMKLQLLQGRGSGMIAENPDELVRKAESDPDYFDSLRFGAAVLLFLDQDLPSVIRLWVSEYLQGKKERPSDASGRGSSIGWHIRIAMAVKLLVHSGMKATRNDASKKTSACDAVAQALSELGASPNSFARVKKIWLEIQRATDETGVMRLKF